MAPVATTARWRLVPHRRGPGRPGRHRGAHHHPDGTAPFAYRGGFLLSALSAAALITGAVCVAGGPVATVLSLRPLVWMGTVSYGAYLWHFPVSIELDTARTGLGGLSLLAVRVAATFALAAASYYLVERPVMEGVFWRTLTAALPGRGRPRGHRRRGGGRHRGPGHRGGGGAPVPGDRP